MKTAEDGTAQTGSGLPETLKLALTAVGFLIPVGLYFWLIAADGVDMLRADQWSDVLLLRERSHGALGFSQLWMQHGENRVFFQNLVTLLLARWFNDNVLIDEYLSATFLVTALILIVLAHHRRSPGTPWFWYCPVAFLLLTLGQWGGTLFGYTFGWYLIILCLALTLNLLDKITLSWLAWSVAAGAAIIASFSSLQGLFVWIAGLTILLQRKRPARMWLAWIGVALLTTGVYFYHWDPAQGGGVTYALGHPGEALQYFFFAIGDVVSIGLPNAPSSRQYVVLVFGVAIFAVAVWSLVRHGFRADDSTARPLGVALIWMGLLFAAGAATARAVMGISNAGFSAYVAFDVLILLGSFLVVIDRRPPGDPATTERGPTAIGFQATVVLLVVVQVIAGTINGVRYGNQYRSYQVNGAIVDAQMGRVPDDLVTGQLGSNQSAAFIRQMTAYARAHHLALFSTARLQWYERQLVPTTSTAVPVVAIGKPHEGAVLRGGVFLDASVSGAYGVTSVQFFARKGRGPKFRIGSAVVSPVGWLGGWDTTRQPNGAYSLEAVASARGGVRAGSRWVSVQIRN